MKAIIELPQSLESKFNADAKYFLKGDSSRLLYAMNAINDYDLGANLVPGQFKALYDNPDVDFYALSDVATIGGATDKNNYGYTKKIVKDGVEIKHQTVFVKDADFYAHIEENINQSRQQIQAERNYAE